jgi:ribosomal protein S18 acetylase RimI-like enzyme
MQSPSPPQGYKIRSGIPSDVIFLGVAIRESERDVHGRGIWDTYCGYGSDLHPDSEPITEASTDLVGEALSYVVLNSDTTCLYHYTNFVVIATDATNEPVACACYFKYPTSSILDTVSYIANHMKTVHGWTQIQVDEGMSRLDFLDKSYPGDIDYEGKWMIEGVYVAPFHRRKGLATIVTQAAYEKGRGESKSCLISVSIGNTSALSCYTEKLGFVKTGETPKNDDCYKSIGCWGFIYLELIYS